MTTAAEQQALDEIAAATARGEDVFGDDEDIVAAGPDDNENEPDSSIDAPATPDAGEPVATDASAEPVADPEPEPEPKTESQQPTAFKADMPADYKAQRTELLKAKADAMKKLMDGEMDAEEFATAESAIADKLEDLTAARIRAETLQEANVQNQAVYQQREIQKLIRNAKADVDYTKDPSAAKQFDTALAVISADPDNKGADYADLIADAHKMVLAMRGLKAAPAPATKHEQRKPDGQAPVTLRSLPAAATSQTNGGVLEQLSRLKGPAYETAFNKLSPAQRAELLDESTGD